jgi:hypothetical protein
MTSSLPMVMSLSLNAVTARLLTVSHSLGCVLVCVLHFSPNYYKGSVTYYCLKIACAKVTIVADAINPIRESSAIAIRNRT